MIERQEELVSTVCRQHWLQAKKDATSIMMIVREILAQFDSNPDDYAKAPTAGQALAGQAFRLLADVASLARQLTALEATQVVASQLSEMSEGVD